MSSDVAVRVEGLGKAYTIRHQQSDHVTLAQVALERAKHPLRRYEREKFWALQDVSFEVKQGEAFGVIGRNGAGKSTLLKLLTRITGPSAGRIDLWGRVGSLLEVGTGFHPELTGRENIYLNGSILGMGRKEIDREFDAIVDFAAVEKFLDTPVKRFSSGMYVRLAFAVAVHLDTEILLVDEVLAVGDADFQQKCLGKMEDVASKGRTVFFVSHNVGLVAQLTTNALLLEGGHPVKVGPTGEVIECYQSSSTSQSATLNDYVPSDSDRWDPVGLSRKVEISGIRVLDASPHLDANADLRVKVRLAARESVSRFRAQVVVLTVDGRGVCSAFSDETLSLDAGEVADVVLRLPEPRLAPAPYLLELSVGHGDHFGSLEHFDVVTKVARFDVAADVRDDGALGLGWNTGFWGHTVIPKLGIENWVEGAPLPKAETG